MKKLQAKSTLLRSMQNKCNQLIIQPLISTITATKTVNSINETVEINMLL